MPIRPRGVPPNRTISVSVTPFCDIRTRLRDIFLLAALATGRLITHRASYCSASYSCGTGSAEQFSRPWPASHVHPRRHRLVALDEIGAHAPGLAHHFDAREAPEDFLPHHPQLHLGEALAHAAVDAEAEGNVLARPLP